jgi:SAM-dependent methyltransferase
MQWHASAARAPYWEALYSFVDSYPAAQGFPRVFDFGCGVGTDALFLAERGYEVTAVDVKGPTFEFARHRLARRGLPAHFVESTSEIPTLDKSFDAAVCFDVFEHLPDPIAAARALVKGLRSGGILLQQATFDNSGVHPCHLGSGIQRFSGLRWHINLTGMGMKSDGPLSYAKCSGISQWIQKSRYDLWRATGLWLIKVDG